MPSSHIALLIEPGSTPSSVMTTLDMINIARRYPQAGDCQVDLLSSMGGAIELAAAVRVHTQAMPASLAGYAAVILPGFFADDVAALTLQLQTLWQPVMARLRWTCGGGHGAVPAWAGCSMILLLYPALYICGAVRG